MNQPLQMKLNVATREQIWQSWAFVSKRNKVVTACSRQAKLFGVRVGMRYNEAKLLVPGMRIMIVGGRNRKYSA